jgi:protein-S-isoprenylcysteine O-methyltransferase Ste14
MATEHRKLSRWGVGPVLAILTVGYTGAVLGISRLLPIRMIIPIQKPEVPWISLVLFAIGIPFLIISLFELHRAYGAGKLVTTGVFSLCRNPIYSSWNLLLVPATVLLLRNWLCLTIPFFMYGLLRALIKKEEEYLSISFGEAYERYKMDVFFILPLSPLFRRRKDRSTL